ncbi:MAG: hypothetical protein NVS2B8_18270 [Vulcanimicrobiaceae bacterium]
MWWYALTVIAWWLVNPEIRRLVDFRVGFNSVSLISGIPLALLLPFWYDVLARGSWKRLPLPMLVAAWLWVGAFAYGFAIALAGGRLLPGAYTFMDFMLPLGIGLWVATRDEISADDAFEKILRVIFVGATVLGIYGIVQYVVMPPWDAYWMQNAGIGSIGKPIPYQVRVFSMLNSVGPFGNFMFVALALATPRLSFRRPWFLAQVGVWLASFALSSDRSAWLAYVVFLIVYCALSPRRLPAIRAAGLTAALAVVMTLGLSAITGSSAASQNVIDRFATLGSTGSDESALNRQYQYAAAFADFQEAPIGQGLGLTNTANKLTNVGQTGNGLDSGIFARLLEMGALGGTLFFLGLLVPIAYGFLGWSSASRERDVEAATSLAMATAILVALLSLEISGDAQRALTGMLTWLIAAYVLRRARSEPLARPGMKVLA